MFTRNMLQSNSFLILIISISILGTISSFLTGFLNFSFDLDLYQIISASNEISKKELGSINFFAYSSLGIDILFWPYIFPPFVYSLFTNLFTNWRVCLQTCLQVDLQNGGRGRGNGD